MARRFSRILQSARYYGAINRYIQWVQGTTTRGQRIGQGDPRPASVKLYLVPFGVALPANAKAVSSAAQPSWNSYSAAIGTHATATAPSDESLIIRLEDYKAARVIVKTNMSNQATVRTSNVTGLQYGSYGGKSTSVPFGRKNGTETELAAFTEIETAIGANLSGNFRISLSKEKFSAA
jgi:hypothetical protein